MEFYRLTNETVDLLSEKIGEMYAAAGCEKKETMRARLLLEEALLKYKSRFGEEVELYFRSYRVLGQYRFSVHLRTEAFDPFTLAENPMAFMIKSVMSSFENGVPGWKYRNLENELLFSIRRQKKLGSLARLLIAVGIAAVLGVIARLLLPSGILTSLAEDYLNPAADAYAGCFCVMAVLLTFFAILLSIVHLGDLASVGALGGKIMRRFFLISAAVTVVFTLPLLPFFRPSGIGSLTIAAKTVYDILVSFIPTGFVAPFLNFNSVHVMLIGAMFGFSLLAMGQKGSTLTELVEETNLVAVYTNNFLNRFIDIYTAVKIFVVVSAQNFDQLAKAGKMVAVIVGGEVLLLILYTAYCCFKTKRSLRSLIKALSPATLVCLSSANFGAAFSMMFDAMLGAGLDGNTVNLSANLGGVFFQPTYTFVFVASSLFMASEFGVEISVAWLILAVLLSIVLVGSMPNIPGAAVSAITLLYAQLGIPAEGLSLMITVNALLQFLTVSVDIWCLQAEMICVDADMKKKKLQSEA